MQQLPITLGLLALVFTSITNLCSQSFEALYEIPDKRDFETSIHLATAASKSQNYPGLEKGMTLTLNPQVLKSITQSKKPLLSLILPQDEGEEVTLLLRAVDITQPGYQLLTKTKSSTTVVRDENMHYRGIIEGKPQSMVTVSLNAGELIAMIIDKKSQKTLAKLKHSDDYIYYNTNDLLVSAGFECSAESLQSFGTQEQETDDTRIDADNCVGMYLESGYDIYLDQGSLEATSLFLTGLFNQVSSLYAAESINLNIQELVIWTQEEPYPGPSASDKLVQFQNALNGQFNGDLAHLIDYGNSGVAYINTLCFDQYAIGYSGINNYYAELPVYSWSTEVLAHEIGHNLGSPHTHACAWNGNSTAIDGCGAAVGAGEGCDGPVPDKGTIMSYCHLVSGVGIDFNLGFGPQPGDLIRNKVYNSSCLSACNTEVGCQTVGLPCDDNDECTIDDTYDEDCICAGVYQDEDGDGYCIGNDPDDTDSCNPDSSSSDCSPGCTEYDSTTAESGFGIWNDGGTDCRRSSSVNYTYEGTYSILIRDNSNAASSTYTDNLPFLGVDEIQLDFVYYPYSMETGEDFFLEISLNGGNQYQLVKSWVSGQEFTNGQFYMESVMISDYQLTNNTRLRLRCDASTNTDRIYLDNLIISTCNPSQEEEDDCLLAGQPCDDGDECTLGETYDLDCNCVDGISSDSDQDGVCSVLDLDDSDACIPNPNHPNCDVCDTEGQLCDDGDPCTLGEVYDANCDCTGGLYTDFDSDGYCVGNDPDDNDPCVPDPSTCPDESCSLFDSEDYEQSIGIWNDGGTDCQRISNTTYATSGSYSIRIRDNSGAQSSVYSDNINASTAQSIEVTFSFKANSMETNEDFLLELSSDGGSTYSLVKDWKSGSDFSNNITYTVTTVINSLAGFTQTTRLRFRCDASTNSDQVYIDDVNIELCGTVATGDIIAASTTPDATDNAVISDRLGDLDQQDPIISIYPNPVQQNGTLQISVKDGASINTLSLYDIYGRLHLTQEINKVSEIYTIAIGELQSGTYLVLVASESKTWPHKIIIQ